jgi:hypothetical protein
MTVIGGESSEATNSVDDQYAAGDRFVWPQLRPDLQIPVELPDQMLLCEAGGALDLGQARCHTVGADEQVG